MNKTILIIGNHLSKSGKNISVGEALACQLRNYGWKVLLTSNKNNKFIRLIDMLLTIFFRRNMYDLAQVDVFSGSAFIWAYLSGYLLKFIKKPFILTLHGGSLPEYFQKNNTRVKNLLLIATQVTTPSTYLYRFFSDFRSDIKLIPNGIDINKYKFFQRKDIRPTFIWLRAFHKIYNPIMAVNVLSKVKEDFPESKLMMIGPDKNDGSLSDISDFSKRKNLDSSLKIIDQIPKNEVPEWLQKGDIFINTTKIESFGISVVEAAACGLCIVTTNVGELSFFWENEVDALLVPSDDDKAMSKAIIRILNDSNLARKLSYNARQKAEKFAWSKVLPVWIKLFENILSKPQ